MINPPDLASVREYWSNNRVKNFHCELYIVSEMVAISFLSLYKALRATFFISCLAYVSQDPFPTTTPTPPPLEACAFGSHLGNPSVCILDPHLELAQELYGKWGLLMLFPSSFESRELFRWMNRWKQGVGLWIHLGLLTEQTTRKTHLRPKSEGTSTNSPFFLWKARRWRGHFLLSGRSLLGFPF